ncbi:MAG: cell division protein FtsQ [Solirubrobacteraceae bacterium]|nr:cell division protein FtsQ [Solirubrobacteraceae bacterium]
MKIAGVAVVAIALYGSWLLLRDAPVFAVKKVAIIGVHGSGAPAIRSSLEDAARGMTTMDVKVAELRTAVASFAVVRDLRVSTQFPHGLRIEVIEEQPVAALVIGARRLPVSADGRIVRGIGTAPGVASIPVAAVPTGDRIDDPVSFAALELLDVAPPALRTLVAEVTIGTHGLTAQLRDGPALYFGDTTRLHAKWAAVAAVLADPASGGAAYVDVHTPDRAAAQVGDAATSGPSVTAPGTAAGPLASGAGPVTTGVASPGAGAASGTPAAPSGLGSSSVGSSSGTPAGTGSLGSPPAGSGSGTPGATSGLGSSPSGGSAAGSGPGTRSAGSASVPGGGGAAAGTSGPAAGPSGAAATGGSAAPGPGPGALGAAAG